MLPPLPGTTVRHAAESTAADADVQCYVPEGDSNVGCRVYATVRLDWGGEGRQHRLFYRATHRAGQGLEAREDAVVDRGVARDTRYVSAVLIDAVSGGLECIAAYGWWLPGTPSLHE